MFLKKLHTCFALFRPGTFLILHGRRVRGCKTGMAFIRVRRCCGASGQSSCIKSSTFIKLHTCFLLLRPGTFLILHGRRARVCRTMAFIWVRGCFCEFVGDVNLRSYNTSSETFEVNLRTFWWRSWVDSLDVGSHKMEACRVIEEAYTYFSNMFVA